MPDIRHIKIGANATGSGRISGWILQFCGSGLIVSGFGSTKFDESGSGSMDPNESGSDQIRIRIRITGILGATLIFYLE